MSIMKKIILASQSPRRKELLEKLDIPFTIMVPNIQENIDTNIQLSDAISQIAKEKALCILDKEPESIVIGADTIVVYKNNILGKPKDINDAYNMLSMLEGNTHQVITGICVASKDKILIDAHTSNVTFDHLNDKQIKQYLNTMEWSDKAGSYAIQGKAAKFIKHIDGDYYSIMGLSLNLLYKMLLQIL